MLDIVELRNQIDKIDDEILDLFLKRLECVQSIGKIKKTYSLDILDKSREKTILKRLTEKSDKYRREISNLFLTIIEISRGIQK